MKRAGSCRHICMGDRRHRTQPWSQMSRAIKGSHSDVCCPLRLRLLIGLERATRNPSLWLSSLERPSNLGNMAVEEVFDQLTLVYMYMVRYRMRDGWRERREEKREQCQVVMFLPLRKRFMDEL